MKEIKYWIKLKWYTLLLWLNGVEIGTRLIVLEFNSESKIEGVSLLFGRIISIGDSLIAIKLEIIGNPYTVRFYSYEELLKILNSQDWLKVQFPDLRNEKIDYLTNYNFLKE